jgi:hypothetical protein
MTKPPFDLWAPTEISRLRRQADELEAALTLYLRLTPDGQASSSPLSKSMPSKSILGRRRPSKYENLFEAFEDTGRVLSMDEMMTIAERLGLHLDRANLRSQVFAQKSAGRAHPEGSGYRWVNPEKLTAPPAQEDAA